MMGNRLLWLIRGARYLGIALSMIALGVVVLLDDRYRINWLAFLSVPLLLLVVRALQHRSLVQAIHAGLFSVPGLLAGILTLPAAILMGGAFIGNRSFETVLGMLITGGTCAGVAGYLYEVAGTRAASIYR